MGGRRPQEQQERPSDDRFDAKRFVREVQRTIDREGISQRALAQASRVGEANLCAVLSGRQYLGRVRASKLQDALHDIIAQKRAEAATQKGHEGHEGHEAQDDAHSAV